MTSTGSRRTRARRGEGERLRDDILAATMRLMEEHGDESAVSIRAVADAVGVTPPSIYLHFADKSVLLFEVCRDQFGAFDAALAAAEEGIEHPVEALRAMGRAYVMFGLEHPVSYRVLFMHKPEDRPAEVDMPEFLAATGFGRLTGRVQQCIDGGWFEGDPMTLAVMLWAGVHGITSLLLSHPGFPWPDMPAVIDRVLDGLMQGAAPRP